MVYRLFSLVYVCCANLFVNLFITSSTSEKIRPKALMLYSVGQTLMIEIHNSETSVDMSICVRYSVYRLLSVTLTKIQLGLANMIHMSYFSLVAAVW